MEQLAAFAPCAPFPIPVFEPPCDPSPADIADFEEFVSRSIAWRQEPERGDLERYLRRFPGHSVRDWKGKGLPCPLDADERERPWRRLKAAEVQIEATKCISRELPRNLRQAAARDPALIWNPLARKYRLRLPSDPLPGHESSSTAPLGTGGVPERKSKHAILADSARPRVGARGADHEN